MKDLLASLLGRMGGGASWARTPPCRPATFDEFVAAGDCARDAHDWGEAIVNYRAAAQLRPNADHIMVQLGHALKESGQYDEAVACYRSFARAHPDDADIHLQMGHLFLTQELPDDAGPWYAQALERASAGSSIAVDARRGLDACAQAPLLAARKAALALTDCRRYREAYEKLSNLVEQYGCEDLTGVLGNVAKEIGNFGEARDYYRRFRTLADRLGPDEMFDAELQMGHLAKVERNYIDAIKHFICAETLLANSTKPSCTSQDLKGEIRTCLAQITSAITLS
jgi:tetratricopeptide (TPR) repeat protein